MARHEKYVCLHDRFLNDAVGEPFSKRRPRIAVTVATALALPGIKCGGRGY